MGGRPGGALAASQAIIHLNLLVLKTPNVERLVTFYAALGITFAEERHGTGPAHHAGRVGPTLLEVYLLPADAAPDSTTRLGFAVEDVDATVERLRHLGATVRSEPKRTPFGYRAVVADPDGRAVEVVDRRGDSPNPA
jgi:predicted enzyme related to lactoylglutathione lyase